MSLTCLEKDRNQLAQPQGFEDGELPQHLQTLQSLEFRSVTFSYPTQPEKIILNQLSFKAPSPGSPATCLMQVLRD